MDHSLFLEFQTEERYNANIFQFLKLRFNNIDL